MNVSVRPSIYLCIYTFSQSFIHPSAVYLSIRPPTPWYMYLSLYLFIIHLQIYESIQLSIHLLPISVSIHNINRHVLPFIPLVSLCVCLTTYPSISTPIHRYVYLMYGCGHISIHLQLWNESEKQVRFYSRFFCNFMGRTLSICQEELLISTNQILHETYSIIRPN